MPLVEYICCMNCHSLLQRIAVLETQLFAGLPKQAEQTADGHDGPLCIQLVSPVNLVNHNSLYQV